MKKIYLFMVALCFTSISNAQVVFSEDFFNGIPSTWTLTDVDGLIPDPNVAQFNNAWIGAADFDNTTDTVAMSTSWYSPTGSADDWMASPAINLTTNNVLTWEEEGQDANYADGYEVYISTTGPTPADFLGVNGTMLFNIATSSPATWVTRSLDLQALGFSSQTVYLAWRNNATNQFILMIDDILIQEIFPFDASVTNTFLPEYSLIPISQTEPIGTGGTINNLGGSAVTNATLNVDVFDGTMTNVYSASSTPIASLASGASNNVTVPGFTPSLPDLYTVQLVTSITEMDGDSSNDTATYTVTFTDSTYARDDGNVTGSLGIGPGTSGELGQNFVLNAPDTLTSVDAFIANGGGNMTNQPFSCNIYDVTNGTVGSLLGTTDTITIDTSTNTLWNLPINGGSLSLNGVDTFAVIAQEGDSNITLGTATNIFTQNTTWVLFGTNPWTPNEGYGFNVSYVLRANFGIVTCATSASSITEVVCGSYTAPSGAVFTSSGTINDTIMNAAGCDSIITISLTVNNVNSTISASGDTLTATMVGATSYQWVDCGNGNAPIMGATNQTYIATANGNYALIITANGCTDTSACANVVLGCATTTSNATVVECDSYTAPSGAVFTSSGTVNDTIMNAAGCDSIITINLTINAINNMTTASADSITASMAGATYQWIDCNNGNAPIAGATDQTFVATSNGDYAVIVTANGCTDTSACVNVIIISVADRVNVLTNTEIFPNPSNGEFTLSFNGLVTEELTIDVIDVTGRVVMSKIVKSVNNNLKLPIDLNAESGTYFIKLSANGLSETKQLVIFKK